MAAGISLMEKIPPQSIDSEMSVLGAMLMDKEAIGSAMGLLEYDDFYRDAHRKIYQTIISMYNKNEPADIVTVSTRLQSTGEISSVGGMVYLTMLVDSVITSANIEYYAKIIQDKALLRKLIRTATKIVELGYSQYENVNEIMLQAEDMMSNMSHNKGKSGYVTTHHTLLPYLETVEQRYLNSGNMAGLATGYYDLDYMLGGLQPQQIIVIAARPSMGKSALMANITVYLSKKGISTGIISLESSQAKIIDRFISIDSQIDSMKIARGQLTKIDMDNITKTCGTFATKYSPICITIDDNHTMEGISNIAHKMKHEQNIGLLVIDHIGLITPSKKATREQEMAEISRKIRNLAKRLDIPIISISQLSRGVNARTDKRPTLSDLRDSGTIEQDADVVIFLYRDAYYDKNSLKGNITELIVAKNRDGKTGMVEVLFQPECLRFVNLSEVRYA